MGKRGPKPTREPTTHIRVPVSLAEKLREIAIVKKVSIPVLLDSVKHEILNLLPMPPSMGPPLPRKMGVKWPGRTGKRG